MTLMDLYEPDFPGLSPPLSILTTCTIAYSWPRRARMVENKGSFVGESTNDLTTAILQSYVDDDSNLAFSPLGYSAILAILSEGAKGDTYNQLSSALKLPQDRNAVRKTYREIMERLRNTNEYRLNIPEFKNWFYVYKNYTVNEDYRKILEEYYLTEVKSVKKYDSSFFHVASESNDKEDKVDPLPTIEIKDPVKSEEKKKEEEKIISFAMEDTPEKVQDDKKPGESVKKDLESDKDLEIMEAVEAKSHARSGKGLFQKEEVTNGLSANRVGNKESNSIMILFNGLYFRGSWKTPFVVEDDGVFYKSADSKKSVPMMKSTGLFKTGSLPGLDSTAVEIPYNGGRYALLVIKPRTRDGLRRLAADLADLPPSRLPTLLDQKNITVKMPSFYVETTTKPLTAFAKFGVGSIFSPDADLSGISPVDGLFVQEMVQHVSVKVDNADTTHSLITAAQGSQILERSRPIEEVRQNQEVFLLDHPFFFFIRDVIDDIIVVAGKITEPQAEILK